MRCQINLREKMLSEYFNAPKKKKKKKSLEESSRKLQRKKDSGWERIDKQL